MDLANNDNREKTTLLDYPAEEVLTRLTEQLGAWEVKPYRAKQIVRQVYQRGTMDFSLMSDLPKELRERLSSAYRLYPLYMSQEAVSRDGTVKHLWKADDGRVCESVIIPMERGHQTVCLSSQTGCAMACAFCATGMLGAGRNLTAGEIVSQALYQISRGQGGEIRDNTGGDSDRSANFVFMGMGEPLRNYENLADALRVMNSPELMQIGARRITVSTIGLPEQMIRLSHEFPQVKLAISLHAAEQDLRLSIIPVARKVSLDKLLEACHECNRITNRRITFEYILLPGVNDRDSDITALTKISRNLECKVNLIGYNPVEGLPFRKPTRKEVFAFRDKLFATGKIAVSIREAHGLDIAGACGQLAAGQNRGRVRGER